MLDHPWLNMEPNYNYKLSKKEWEKIQFKKDSTTSFATKYFAWFFVDMKKEAEPFAEDAKLEMGELVDSDPELYHCDTEGKRT